MGAHTQNEMSEQLAAIQSDTDLTLLDNHDLQRLHREAMTLARDAHSQVVSDLVDRHDVPKNEAVGHQAKWESHGALFAALDSEMTRRQL